MFYLVPHLNKFLPIFRGSAFLLTWARSAHGELLWSVSVRRPSCVVRRQAIALKAYSSYTPGPIDSILGRKHQSDFCRSKLLKSFRPRIQDGRHGRRLENLFFASSPEPKGQLTPNLVGSIGVTCRSKIAKIVLIRNPRWPQLKIYFSLLLLNPKANWLQTW